jgi:hypothetical protein
MYSSKEILYNMENGINALLKTVAASTQERDKEVGEEITVFDECRLIKKNKIMCYSANLSN